MALPTSLLQHIETHPCFSGCYGSNSDVSTCLDPAGPLVPMVVFTCHDCFAYFGVLRSLLPAGASAYWLADQVSQHVRQRRGFALSFSGYSAKGPGFWVGAVYYAAAGVFLVNGERSRNLGSDLDLLRLAFQHSVAVPPDRRMLDASHYATQEIYVRFPMSTAPLASRQALLASPDCRTQPAPGFQRVTLAEFLPVSRSAAPPAAAQTVAQAAPPAVAAPRPLKEGDVCPRCGAEVRERALLNGSFVGCLC